MITCHKSCFLLDYFPQNTKFSLKVVWNLKYFLPSSVVSFCEVKVSWNDTWYSCSHQVLCMFSQAWVSWEGNGWWICGFQHCPALFLSRCFWDLWWDHCHSGTDIPLGFPVDASIGVRESGHSKCIYFGLKFSLAPWGHLEQTHREVLKFSWSSGMIPLVCLRPVKAEAVKSHSDDPHNSRAQAWPNVAENCWRKWLIINDIS